MTTGINRRGFIAALAAFASTAVLDPEQLLWVPGAKTISIPRGISVATSASLAAQREAMRKMMPAMMMQSSYLWNRIQVRDDISIGSRRPSRIPLSPMKPVLLPMKPPYRQSIFGVAHA